MINTERSEAVIKVVLYDRLACLVPAQWPPQWLHPSHREPFWHTHPSHNAPLVGLLYKAVWVGAGTPQCLVRPRLGRTHKDTVTTSTRGPIPHPHLPTADTSRTHLESLYY